jgi:hypothetical protein
VSDNVESLFTLTSSIEPSTKDIVRCERALIDRLKPALLASPCAYCMAKLERKASAAFAFKRLFCFGIEEDDILW